MSNISLASVLHCVREDNCGLRRNLKLNHLVSTKGTGNFLIPLKRQSAQLRGIIHRPHSHNFIT